MRDCFVDTSALAKRYHTEPGSDVIDSLFEASGQLVISPLTLVELESVLAINCRRGVIDEHARLLARRRFHTDPALRLRVAPFIGDRDIQRASRLVIQYGATDGLRTLDALQLAVALRLHEAGIVDQVVASDQRLCRVAVLTGCAVLNPERDAGSVER